MTSGSEDGELRATKQDAGGLLLRRAGALLLDSVIISPPTAGLAILIAVALALPRGLPAGHFVAIPQVLFLLELVSSAVVCVVYFSWTESSKYAASLGKGVTRLRVSDLAGGRPSFLRSVLRNVFKFLPVGAALGSAAIVGTWMGDADANLVGRAVGILAIAAIVLPIFMTARRQMLHDMIAGCYIEKAGHRT